MAGENGAMTPETPPMQDHLKAKARRYAFFQAVELIQAASDEGREIGTHARAGDEKIIFDVTPKLGFPTSDVVAIEALKGAGDKDLPEDGRYRMTVSFLGLHGSNSPLPSYYPEQIAQHDNEESVTRNLLNFFHSRALGLLHRAWRKYRYYRRYQPGGVDTFSRWIFSCFGLGDDRVRVSSQIYWPRLLCFAGILSTRNRSPSVLANVIGHAFNLDAVEIEEWVMRKVDIPLDQRWSLSGMNSQLGRNTVLGDRAPDVQGKIRVVLQGLDYQRFRDFLPHGKDFKPLRNLVELMLRDQFAYDFKLGLAPNQAYPLTLKSDELGRLGWSSFVGRGHADEPRDVIIQARH